MQPDVRDICTPDLIQSSRDLHFAVALKSPWLKGKKGRCVCLGEGR
jgi:hypothetical protein